MSRNYSEKLANAVETFLIDDDWVYDAVDENGVIRTGITLKSKLKSARIFFDIKSDGISVITIPSVSADEGCMKEVMEFITRANYGLYKGNFEMDVNDGEVRYKSYHYCSDNNVITEDEIKMCLFSNLYTLDRYGDGLMKVIFGMATPEEAIASSEED